MFLISLKAGGTGLNLTSADTVIHYDPWWNPAAQAQATDRAHRIGQTRPVFVYNLIVAGSVEERMLALQRRKRELAQGLLGHADGGVTAPMSVRDVEIAAGTDRLRLGNTTALRPHGIKGLRCCERFSCSGIPAAARGPRARSSPCCRGFTTSPWATSFAR